ncbi:hypothetical protein [Streptomyces sp. NPDC003077]|uniref:hypothetical protein n=1 Tax=Streptomyces sp. NPDC003077 TaxID=3154443 RepID=UPI0033B3D20A
MPSPSADDVHQFRLNQLAVFLRESEQILASWDAYSDEHTDRDGWPYDDQAYGRRAAARDAATWRSFNRVRQYATHLLASAEAQLQQLSAPAVQPRWAWQLGVLQDALRCLDDLQREWLVAREALPGSAAPGTEAYEAVLDERNSEAWHPLNQWGAHGQVLLDIHTAARTSPSRLPPAPAKAPTVPGATATRSTKRR